MPAPPFHISRETKALPYPPIQVKMFKSVVPDMTVAPREGAPGGLRLAFKMEGTALAALAGGDQHVALSVAPSERDAAPASVRDPMYGRVDMKASCCRLKWCLLPRTEGKLLGCVIVRSASRLDAPDWLLFLKSVRYFFLHRLNLCLWCLCAPLQVWWDGPALVRSAWLPRLRRTATERLSVDASDRLVLEKVRAAANAG